MNAVTAPLPMPERPPVVLFRMTSDEFLRLPEAECPLELIDGAVVMAAQPLNRHQRFLSLLFGLLNAWVEANRLGRVYPDCGVRLSDTWIPAPDLSYLSNAHLGRDLDSHIDGPVDLAVEILSPSNTATDRVTKFEAYARYGVGWYWIVDLEARTLEEYENTGGTFRLLATVPFSVPFQPRLFPGLTIDLAAIL
jgi:Uma2 family endonuclease